MMTVDETATRLKVSTSTVYALCKTGQLPCYRIGANGRGKVLIDEADVESFLAASRAKPRPPHPSMLLRHIKLPRT